jgi:hypothetical protein
MGEVIVFKLEKNGTHLRPPPEGSAKIFFFQWCLARAHGGNKRRDQVWEKQALSRLKLGNGLKFGCAGGALAALKPSHRQKRPPILPAGAHFCPGGERSCASLI